MATVEKKTLPGQDPKIEAWLEEHGVTEYEFKPKLSLSSIDKEASLHNQARYRALDDDRVLLVAEAMEREPGDVPPMVLYQRPRKKGTSLEMLDGNHRMAGAELLDRKEWPAYVVTQALTETQQRLLTFAANLKHGLPTGMDERVSHAIWLVEERSTSQEEAAKLMRVPKERVQVKLTLIRSRRRLEAMGVDVSKLGVSNSRRLDAIKSDEVLKETAKLIVDAKIRTDETSNLISKINAMRSEKAQLDFLDQERKARKPQAAATAGGKVQLPPLIKRTQSAINAVMRIDVADLRDAKVDEVVKRQLKSRATEATRRLAAVIESL